MMRADMHRVTEKEVIGKNGAFFVKFSYLEKMKNFQIGVFGCKTRKKWKQLEKHVRVINSDTHHATDELTKSGRRSKFRSTPFLLFCKRVPKLFGNGN